MKSMSAARSNQILALLAVAQLMGVLDFSIVNVALPSIQRTFHLVPVELQWIVSAYALTLGVFLLLAGLFPATGMNLHIFWTMIVMHCISALITVSLLTTLAVEQ